ncbi:hypothetical protein BDV12DRAFT_171756 [Aspergillus spectabilis]
MRENLSPLHCLVHRSRHGREATEHQNHQPNPGDNVYNRRGEEDELETGPRDGPVLPSSLRPIEKGDLNVRTEAGAHVARRLNVLHRGLIADEGKSQLQAITCMAEKVIAVLRKVTPCHVSQSKSMSRTESESNPWVRIWSALRLRLESISSALS